MTRILVLGGTTEARALCTQLAHLRIPTEVSLAGVVSKPRPYAVPHRVGGFGGAMGLAQYLRDNGITALIDATHPFAVLMPHHAGQAARMTETPWTMLKRPEWSRQEGDNWLHVPDMQSAAAALPKGARAFLATGAGSLNAFLHRVDCHLTLRQLAVPPALAGHISVLQASPGDLASETALLRSHRITHLVAKNSGGPTRAKLDAARALALPVILVDRPALPVGPVFFTAHAAAEWALSIA